MKSNDSKNITMDVVDCEYEEDPIGMSDNTKATAMSDSQNNSNTTSPSHNRNKIHAVDSGEISIDICHNDAGDGSSDHFAAYEEKVEIGEDESKAVNRVRCILMIVLLCVAAAVSTSVYLYSRHREAEDFKRQFVVHADKIMEAVRTTTERSLRAIEGFALQITIHSIDHHQTWPNVALSDFETRASITIDLADAISLIFIPIVTLEDRAGWESFSIKNQGWLSHGLTSQKDKNIIPFEKQKDDEESIQKIIQTYGGMDTETIEQRQQMFESVVATRNITNRHVPPIPEEIFRLDGHGIKTTDQSTGPYLPIWQFAPAFPVSQMVNYNALSSPTHSNELMAIMETEKTIVGKAFDYSRSADDERTSLRGAILNIFLNRRNKGKRKAKVSESSSSSSGEIHHDSEYTGGPVSDLYSPIFSTYTENRTMVGILTSYVYWQVYFENVLPENVKGLIAVLENTCNQTYTFEINGAKATYLGEGDLHDPRYDYLEFSTGYGGVFLQKKSDIDLRGQCLANIRMYPSEIMETTAITTTPLLFSIICIATFVFTSLIFIWYQYLVDRRQMVVLTAAIQSTAVVQSLFPAAVRERLFEENNKQQQHQIYQQRQQQQFMQQQQQKKNQFYNTNPQQLRRQSLYHNHVQMSLSSSVSSLPDIRSFFGGGGGGGGSSNAYDSHHNESGGYGNSFSKIRCNSMDMTPSSQKKQAVVTSEVIFGSKPIADFFPNTTIMFADMVGFTAWASVREPTQVFVLLETVYNAYDNIAKRMRVFKVETVGDCYVAVAGLPTPREDHAVVMAKFATSCLNRMTVLCRELETTLGPDTADLGVRVGLHSGPVTAGVLRGDKGRFQLFGDTMNTASRMESTGMNGRIQLSQDTTDLLIDAGRANWISPREHKIVAKGKGELQTYWLKLKSDGADFSHSSSNNNNELASNDGNQNKNVSIATTASVTNNNKQQTPVEKEIQNEQSDQLSKEISPIAKKMNIFKSSAHSARSFKIGNYGSGRSNSNNKMNGRSESESSSSVTSNVLGVEPKTVRLIQWNVDVLSRLLRQIASRRATTRRHTHSRAKSISFSESFSPPAETVLDEVVDIISLPKFDAGLVRQQKNIESIHLSSQVTEQLTNFVTTIASKYRDNPFHNFEHASHVTMSVTKLLSRIVNPVEVSTTGISDDKIASDLHDHTFGITSDPLTQFACMFSALVHDLDHPGVTNATLVTEDDPMAKKYKNKSIAEQNSVDLAWDILMNSPEYYELRNCIYTNSEELKRFRQLFVNIVLATDIMDKDLGALRKARWDKAFSENYTYDNSTQDVNRRATIVIEHLIQASDVSHTMQHWQVYRKWNERLFNEMYAAYKNGRVAVNPADSWYQGEIGFFDYYILPLARKLETCGVFGVSSDEYLNYALANRQEWEKKGEQIVKDYLQKFDENQNEDGTS